MPEIMQYVPGTSLLHGLNPLPKLLMVVLVAILAITTNSLGPLVLLVAVILLSAAVMGLAGPLIRQLPLLISLTLSLLLLTVLTMEDGATIAYLIPSFVPVIGGAIPITTGAIQFGLILSLRFFAMLFAFQLLVITTMPDDLVHALRRLRLPADYALIFLIALRFIPSLQLEGQRIREAQLARGYNPGKGIQGLVRTLAPIVVPLVSNSLGKANVLGLTIDLRGYRAPHRISLRDRSMKRRDLCAVAFLIVSSGVYLAFCELPLLA